jgi:hypothetical protein
VHAYHHVYTVTCIITRVNLFACRKEKNKKKIRLRAAEENFYTTDGYLFKSEFAETYSVFCSRRKHEPASPLKETRLDREQCEHLYTRRCSLPSKVPFPVAREKNNLIYCELGST